MSVTVKAKPKYLSRMVCENCGSEDVYGYATVYWDYDKQEWRFDEFNSNDDWCNNCQSETCIEEKTEAVEPPTWPPEWPPDDMVQETK